MNRQILVEVAYGLPDRQILLALDVPEGTTAAEAVALSGILTICPDIDPATARMGIFGKLVEPQWVLRERDRVEIYRGLLADPKEVRRKRASKHRDGAKGNAAP